MYSGRPSFILDCPFMADGRNMLQATPLCSSLGLLPICDQSVGSRAVQLQLTEEEGDVQREVVVNAGLLVPAVSHHQVLRPVRGVLKF